MKKVFSSLTLVSILSVIGISACSETASVDEQPKTNSVEVEPSVEKELLIEEESLVEEEPLIEAKTSVDNARSINSDDVGLSIQSNVDGVVSYKGSAVLSGTFTVREGHCEYCFHIDDKSASLIPEPSPEIDSYVVAIPSNETGILDLENNDKCYSMPVILELTNYSVDLEGLESFHSADVKRVVEKGEITESECDFVLI